MDKLTELERILYVYCKAREQQAGFSINKGNNEVTIENIKSFFDENPSGQMFADLFSHSSKIRNFKDFTTNQDLIDYSQTDNLKFDEVNWEKIFALPLEERNNLLSNLFLHGYDWGCYWLDVVDNQLCVSAPILNSNAFYDYLEEDIAEKRLSVEEARNFIHKNISKDNDVNINDLGLSEFFEIKEYFKNKPIDDPERFYFQKFRELTYQEAIEFTKQIQEDSLYTVSFCGNIKIPSKNQTEYLNEQAISVCDNLENTISEDGKHPIKVVGMRYFIQHTESPHGFLNRSLIAGVDIEMTVQVKKDISKEDMESFLDLSKDCHYLVEDTDFDVGKVTIEQVGNKWEIVNDDMERE